MNALLLFLFLSGTGDIVVPASVVKTNATADTAPRAGVVKTAQNASSIATTAGSKLGAANCTCAGIGTRIITVTATTATTGKAVTLSAKVNCNPTATATVITEGGGSWVCPNGTAVADCALSLKNAIAAVASATNGIKTATCSTAGGVGCTDGIVAVAYNENVCGAYTTDNAAGEITQTESLGGKNWHTSYGYIGGNELIYEDMSSGALIWRNEAEAGVQINPANISCAGFITATTYFNSIDLNLTDATATASNKGYLRTATAQYTVTNAILAACSGGADTCDITMVTLPLKTQVNDVQFIVDVAETHLTNLTVSCGRTGAVYIDYLAADNAQSQQLIGDEVAERGANNNGYDTPAYAWGGAPTAVKCQFITTDAGHTLNDVTAFSGWMAITTTLLP